MKHAFAAFLLTSLAAQAETGPPSAEEFATARSDCATEVRQQCLFLLATEVALASPEVAEGALNEIAFAQVSFGDGAAAERTLALTTPSFLVLALLGRDEEAAAAFKANAEEHGLKTMPDPSPPSDGEIKLNKVKSLLKAGQVETALDAALSISENDHVSRPKALRAIVDHHIAAGSFAAAVNVAKNMAAEAALAEMFHELDGGYNDPHSDALSAVVAAQAASGDLAGAAQLADRLTDPRAKVSAHLVLARAAFDAGATDLVRAQLGLVLSGVRDLEPALVFGTMTLTQSADLALLHGKMDIAREHAEAAYRVGSRPTVRRGGQGRPPAPSKIILLQLATVLHLVGSTEKASALYDRASVPYKAEPFSTLRTMHLATLLVAQVRLGDQKGAAETLDLLFAMDGIMWQDGRPTLHMAAQSLIDLGFLKEALAIADRLEADLRSDLLGFHGPSPAALYAAILAKDPSLASEVLKDSLGAGAHFNASLALARSLAASGQADKAREVLRALPADHLRRAVSQTEFHYSPICALSFIALTQDEAGITADAEASRQKGLAAARAQADPGQQVADLLVLAASFPGSDASSLSYGLGCLEYHE
jgi:hypothetical protein